MAKGDISLYKDPSFGSIGTRRYQVAAGAAASINAGEPVMKTLGVGKCAALTTNLPDASSTTTGLIVGIAQGVSTDTVAAAGTVDVLPIVPGQVFLCAPLTAATWNTQTLYNALVGSRVLFDLTGGVYTITASDSVNNGLVVEDLDVSKYPGLVAFSIRTGALYSK